MRILFEQPDGSLAILIPVDMSLSLAEHAKRKPHPDAKHVATIPKENLPQDRTFRDAWKHDAPAKAVAVHMPKAKDIWKDKMRAVRNPKLAALDVEFQRALEKEDLLAQKEIIYRKQALRDVTSHPDIEAADTPEKLKAVWPEVLK